VAAGGGGTIAVAGYTLGSLARPNQGDFDAWVAKLKADGTFSWKRQLGSAAYDVSSGVALDGSGNTVIGGWTLGSLARPNQGEFDAWAAKYDPEGHLVWKRQFGTSLSDGVGAEATDGSNNVILAGSTNGALRGPNRGDYDAWVAKLDPDGHVLWLRQLGTAKYDVAEGAATDGDGNIVIAGWTAGALGGPNQGGLYDAWVAKYDAAGHLKWKRQLGTPETDVAEGVAADGNGNVVVAGHTQGSLAGPNQGDEDAWVAMYDAGGRLLWKRQLGTAGEDQARTVAADNGGGALIAGHTASSLGGHNQGALDAWVAKFDANGHLQWKRQLGTVLDDAAQGVTADASGDVVIAGETAGDLCGAPRGGGDAFIAKYRAD
jgi:hypothetical protein